MITIWLLLEYVNRVDLVYRQGRDSIKLTQLLILRNSVIERLIPHISGLNH